MEFDATLELDGKTATGITVPPEIVESLGAGKRPAVRVTINGHTFSTTIGSRSGEFKIPVSAERRQHADVAAGDQIRVSIAVETAPAELQVPPDLAGALGADRAASDFFSSLTTSQRKGFIVSIESAKTADTRQRRVERAMAALKAGQKRP